MIPWTPPAGWPPVHPDWEAPVVPDYRHAAYDGETLWRRSAVVSRQLGLSAAVEIALRQVLGGVPYAADFATLRLTASRVTAIRPHWRPGSARVYRVALQSLFVSILARPPAAMVATLPDLWAELFTLAVPGRHQPPLIATLVLKDDP